MVAFWSPLDWLLHIILISKVGRDGGLPRCPAHTPLSGREGGSLPLAVPIAAR